MRSFWRAWSHCHVNELQDNNNLDNENKTVVQVIEPINNQNLISQIWIPSWLQERKERNIPEIQKVKR